MCRSLSEVSPVRDEKKAFISLFEEEILCTPLIVFLNCTVVNLILNIHFIVYHLFLPLESVI